jgi:hypothetical protein
MKYTVDFSLKPNGTFSVTEVIANSKSEAELHAIDTAKQCGYPLSSIKKIKVKEVK